MRARIARLISLQCAAVSLIGCAADQSLNPFLVVGPHAAVLSAPPVAAPANPGASAASENTVDIIWLDKSDNESGFEVHRSTSGPNGTYTLLATTAANATSYRDSALVAATQYCYQVRAVRVSGNKKSYSSFSNPVCATTASPPPPPPPSPPSAASMLSVTPMSSTTLDVVWVDNSPNEDGFRVYRSTDGGATWGLAETEAAGGVYYVDWGREPERLVCYRVVAFNAGGDAPPSNALCNTPPAAPVILSVSVADTEFEVTWSDNSAVEDGYQVWYYTTGSCCSGACNAFDPWAGEWLLADLPPNASRARIGKPGGCSIQLWVVAVKSSGNSDQAVFTLP